MTKRKHRRTSKPPVPPSAGESKASGVIEQEIKNRWRGKTWLLTYSNLPDTYNHEDIIGYLQKQKHLNIIQWVVGKEKFKDNEKHHWHVWIKLKTEKDTQDHKWAWIEEFSCDYSKAKNYNAIEYAMKDMDFIKSGKIDFFPTSHNYKKRKMDHNEWYIDRFQEAREELKWPIILPKGHIMTKPDKMIKKRHWWIRAPPNFGKSKWLEELGNKKFFVIMGADNPLEHYRDEDLIIIISCKLEWSLIEWLTETFSFYVPAPGKQRYSQILSKPNHTKNILYLGNDLPNYGNYDQPFLERFNVLNLYDFIL